MKKRKEHLVSVIGQKSREIIAQIFTKPNPTNYKNIQDKVICSKVISVN